MKFSKMMSMVKKCSFDNTKQTMIEDLLPEVSTENEEKITLGHIVELLKSFSFDQGKNQALNLLLTKGYVTDLIVNSNSVNNLLAVFSHGSNKVIALTNIINQHGTIDFSSGSSSPASASPTLTSLINQFSFDNEKLEVIKLMVNNKRLRIDSVKFILDMVKCFSFSTGTLELLKLLIPLFGHGNHGDQDDDKRGELKEEKKDEKDEWQKLFDAEICPPTVLLELLKSNPRIRIEDYQSCQTLVESSIKKGHEKEKETKDLLTSASHAFASTSGVSIVSRGKETTISFSTWKIFISNLGCNLHNCGASNQTATINFSNAPGTDINKGKLIISKLSTPGGIAISTNDVTMRNFRISLSGSDYSFGPKGDQSKTSLDLLRQSIKNADNVKFTVYKGTEKIMDVVVTTHFL